MNVENGGFKETVTSRHPVWRHAWRHVVPRWRHTYHTCRRISCWCLSSRCTPRVSSRTCWHSLVRQSRRPACCRRCPRSCRTAVDIGSAPSDRPETGRTALRSYSACRDTDRPCPAGKRSRRRRHGGRRSSTGWRDRQRRRREMEKDSWPTS